MMKKIVAGLFLLCAVASCGVTRRDVREAKAKYLHHKQLLNDGVYYSQYDVIKTGEIIDSCHPTPERVALDSLYYEGLKAIRHDQKIWVKKH